MCISRIMQTVLLLRHFITVDSSKKSQDLKTLYWNIRVKYRPEFFCKIVSNLSPITYSYFFSHLNFGLDFILHQSDQYTKTYAVCPLACTVDARLMFFRAERLRLSLSLRLSFSNILFFTYHPQSAWLISLSWSVFQ